MNPTDETPLDQIRRALVELRGRPLSRDMVHIDDATLEEIKTSDGGCYVWDESLERHRGPFLYVPVTTRDPWTLTGGLLTKESNKYSGPSPLPPASSIMELPR